MKEDVCERDVAKVAEMKREAKWPGPGKDSTAGFLDVERNKLISVESGKWKVVRPEATTTGMNKLKV